jgi:O-antigen/teichoic acid export membrane protein
MIPIFLNKIYQAKNSFFIKNFIILIFGSALGQVLPILVLPILTKLYTPANFGHYGLFLSITSLLTIVSTGGYHMSIVIEENNLLRKHLFALSCLLPIILSVIVFFALKSDFVIQILPFISPILSEGVYLIPFTILVNGLYAACYYYVNREGKFNNISLGKFVKGLIFAITAVMFGYHKFGANGLYIANFLACLFSLIITVGMKNLNVNKLRIIKTTELLKVLKKYNNFPKLFIPGQLLNRSSSDIPQYLFTSFFSSVVAGYYYQVFNTIGAPLAFISNAIGEVFRPRAIQEIESFKSCRRIFLKTFFMLVSIAIVPTLIVFLYSEELFASILGEEWRTSGRYAKILIFLYFFSFCMSPISSVVIHLRQKLEVDFIWQLVLFLGVTLSIFIGVKMNDIMYSIMFFTATYCIMYIANFLLAFKFSKIN